MNPRLQTQSGILRSNMMYQAINGYVIFVFMYDVNKILPLTPLRFDMMYTNVMFLVIFFCYNLKDVFSNFLDAFFSFRGICFVPNIILIF